MSFVKTKERNVTQNEISFLEFQCTSSANGVGDIVSQYEF
jgi:hypothetical protein